MVNDDRDQFLARTPSSDRCNPSSIGQHASSSVVDHPVVHCSPPFPVSHSATASNLPSPSVVFSSASFLSFAGGRRADFSADANNARGYRSKAVGRSVVRSVGQSIGRLVSVLLGRSICELFGRVNGRCVGPSVGRLVSELVDRSVDRSVGWSVGW